MTSPIASPTMARPTNGLATTSLVLGIIAAVGSFIPVLNIGSIILAVLALIFGIIGLVKARKIQVGSGKSITGIVLAIITVIVAIIVNVATVGAVDDALNDPALTATEATTDEAAPEDEPAEEAEQPAEEAEVPAAPEMTVSQEQAVASATSYLEISPFSRQGLIDQLSSSAGDGFPVEDAEFAVDSLDVDWNEQAAKAAQSYLDMTSFSRQGLIDQLSSEAGDQFTVEQATYGVDQTGL